MATGEYSLELLEWAQASSLLAFAVCVRGPEDGFPALLGVSVRSERTGVVDLLSQEVDRSRTIVCLVEHPEDLGDADDPTELYWAGEITFAFWADRTYESELARIPWRAWKYAHLGSLNPYSRVDPCTAAYLESDFTAMRDRFADELFWTAHRIDGG